MVHSEARDVLRHVRIRWLFSSRVSNEETETLRSSLPSIQSAGSRLTVGSQALVACSGNGSAPAGRRFSPQPATCLLTSATNSQRFEVSEKETMWLSSAKRLLLVVIDISDKGQGGCNHHCFGKHLGTGALTYAFRVVLIVDGDYVGRMQCNFHLYVLVSWRRRSEYECLLLGHCFVLAVFYQRL